MSGRQVHAIKIQLGGLADQSFVIWPDSPAEKPCARLLNSRKSWMIATRDDVVMLTTDQVNWQKSHIAQIDLYRVSPAEHNGETVESAQAWINAGEL